MGCLLWTILFILCWPLALLLLLLYPEQRFKVKNPGLLTARDSFIILTFLRHTIF
jgi:hypothetical protein